MIYEYLFEFKFLNGEFVYVMEVWVYFVVVGDLGVKFSKDGIVSIMRKIFYVFMSSNKL